MKEFGYGLKIPKERVAVLIGKDGCVKKEIEDITKSKIDIDSAEGEVFLAGEDPVLLMSVQEIVKAIGRGFNPDIAKLLLKQDYTFDLIDIMDFAKTKKHMDRLKGRIIGMKGKSRRVIEETTETYISVYGKTIAIIGEISNVGLAHKAIEALLSGSQHASVFKWLEKKRRELRLNEMMGTRINDFKD